MPGRDPERESPPTAPPPLIDVRGARVQFGALVAVQDVSMSLRGGDLVGLVGPNGAGKTTLLRAMAGLQPLAGGGVRVLGEVLEPGAPVMAQVGFTPDTPPLYDDMTVRTFLRFVAKGYGLGATDVDARIDYWLERVWLTEKEGQKIKALSRGMRQRVGIARTLLPNPAAILLDEPAAGLDPAGRVQFRRLLCELREQGKALVVSSHILSDMADYCTHIGIMGRGRLVKLGTVSEIAAGAAGAAAADGNGDGAAGGVRVARARYDVTLARDVSGARDLMLAVPGVGGVETDGLPDRFVLTYESGREGAARLLTELVARGLPVASFAPEAIDLEQAYLRAGIRQVD
jgi:ABC-2 type transport system ATP-binding protein